MSVSPENCFHLTVEIVREIRAEAIVRFGGSDGVRDGALLESAVAAPQASCGGKSPYRDLAESRQRICITFAGIALSLMAINGPHSVAVLSSFV